MLKIVSLGLSVKAKLAIVSASSFVVAMVIATRDESVLLPVWVAIICAGGGVLGPVLLGLIQSRARHKDKLENWQREDVRDKRVTDAAKLLAESNKESNKQTNEQLRDIHILVNSNLTEALRAELNSTIRELASLKLIVDMNRERGREPTIEALSVIETTEKRIKELQTNLDHRVKQSKLLDQREAT